MHHGAKRSITQHSLIIWTAVDLPTANVFATGRKELLVQSLYSAIGVRFSIGIACRNWVSVFFNAGWTALTMFWNVSWIIRKSHLQYYSRFWSFSMLSTQKSSPWYANTERSLQMFISKGVDRITEAKDCSLCRYDVILLILRNNARFFLFLNLNLIICFMTYINSRLGLKLITVMLTILAGKRTVFFFRVFTKCANFHGFLDIVGFVGLASVIVPSCIRGCFVGPKYINILSWLFCCSKHLSRENFVGKQKCDWGILTEIFK